MNVPTGEQRIRAFVFSGLREALKPYGFELTGLLRQAGLPDDTGTDGFAWVSLDRFALTLALAARATGDPCFGLKYGAAARLTSNPPGLCIGQRSGPAHGTQVLRSVSSRADHQSLRFCGECGSGSHRVVLLRNHAKRDATRRFRGDALRVAHPMRRGEYVAPDFRGVHASAAGKPGRV